MRAWLKISGTLWADSLMWIYCSCDCSIRKHRRVLCTIKPICWAWYRAPTIPKGTQHFKACSRSGVSSSQFIWIKISKQICPMEKNFLLPVRAWSVSTIPWARDVHFCHLIFHVVVIHMVICAKTFGTMHGTMHKMWEVKCDIEFSRSESLSTMFDH